MSIKVFSINQAKDFNVLVVSTQKSKVRFYLGLGMTFEIEYLSEFDFIFENILG